MPNPDLIPVPFAQSGDKNPIPLERAIADPIYRASWKAGFPPDTRLPKDLGGEAPDGLDFNGVLNAISSHTVFSQNGGHYKWSQDVITNYGGYSKDIIVQSDDGSCEYKSLVDANTVNPNNGIGNNWIVYTGVGSVPLATSTTTGILKVLNNLTTNDVGSALSAAMGKALNDAITLLTNSKLNRTEALGINQSWQNLTSARLARNDYANYTGRPIELSITVLDNNNGSQPYVRLYVNNVMAVNLPDLSGGAAGYQQISVIIPPNAIYNIDVGTNLVTYWAELR